MTTSSEPTSSESVAMSPTGSMLTDTFVPPEPVVPDPDLVDANRPGRDAPKADWVAYAIERGVPSYEAWAMPKAELIREVG